MRAAPSTRSVTRLARLAFGVVASVFLHAVASAPAFANTGLGVQVVFPTLPVTVGQTGLPANIDIQNTSTPDTISVTLTSFKLTPSCGAYSIVTCTSLDPGVFLPSPTGTGRAGTQCAGVNFAITPNGDAEGSYAFTTVPPTPIVLAPPNNTDNLDTCVVDFTISVLKRPTVDASVASGTQTLPGGLVTGTGSDMTLGAGFGTTLITVIPATPAIATVATSGPVMIGTAISDTATLSGGTNPTGTITFNLYAPSDPTCAALPVFSSTVPVNGNGNYGSGNFTSNAVGIYHWIASYSGDANNAPVSGACGDTGESSVVTTASPSFFTQASGTTTAGGTIFDTATLTGVNPTGTITFNLYGPNDATCANASIFTSAVPVNGNGNYPSGNFQPMLVGTYRWIASYSGDANNAGVSGSCNDPNESVAITPANPGITTQAVPTSATIGASVTDTSNLTGGAAPTGTIVFRLYGPSATAVCNDATNLVFTSDAITVNGNGAYGPSTPTFTPATPGTYRWRAFYSGDANNNAVSGACGAANETVTINRANPTLTTTASAGGVVGVSVSDTANLSGGFAPLGGTITFRLYGPSATNVCNSGNLVFTSTAVTVTGAGSYPSPTFTPTLAGTYRWIATYSGDTNNNSRVGTCGEAGETVVITQATPSIVTVASAGGVVGTQLTDTATVSGGSNPTGTVTFRLYGPNDASCSGSVIHTSTVALTAGSATSSAYSTTAPGVYRWTATYNGDTNNASVLHPCNSANESATITQATPSIVTVASAGGVVGTQISDTATVSGGYNPTGTVTFRLYGPNDASCSGSIIHTSTVALTAGNATSSAYTTTAPGVYRWTATYNGDANNISVLHPCNSANESATITQATPSIVTVASAGGVVGTQISDTATVSGGYNPTGTVTFRLYGPNDASCSGSIIHTSTVALTAGNATSSAYTTTAPGVYRWTATYNGDANNVVVAHPCNSANESATITQATPSIVTVASAGGVVGTQISDTATVSGGYNPTGTVTFRLYGPNDASCSGSIIHTSTVALTAGSATSSAFTTTAPGMYRWTATYNGDANNISVLHPCNSANESATITSNTPSIVTVASAGGAIGTQLTDTATVSGGTNPTGTVTFNLYGPNDASCSGTVIHTSTVALTAGSATSSAFTTIAAGVYRWTATYNGDSNNNTVSHPCNSPNESATITQTTPGLVTQASAAIQLGGSVTDTATLSGGTNPTGTITFRLYGPDDATCANAAVFTSGAVTVTGNGAYVSTPSFTPTAVGTYRWIASYSGDPNNIAVTGNCNDANESVVVSQATPSIVTQASPGGQRGAVSVTDAATLSGGTNPTGSITFRLYGPNDATCANTPVFTSNAVPVDGNGTYTSTPGFTPTLPGTYRWIATYSGDAGNAGIAGACNDPNEQVTITDLPPPPDVPIPTMSEWALILMSMLVGLLALVTLRRGRGYR